MMTAEELNYYDAKCETCKYNTIYKAGITYQVCELYSDNYSTLGSSIFKIDDDFVCANWETKNKSKNYSKCSNCKYSQFGPIGEPCRPQHYRCGLLDEKEVDKNFYCSKWEEK